jgi:hypothetical protein
MIKLVILFLVLSAAFALNSYFDGRYEMAMFWSVFVGFFAAMLFVNWTTKK